MTFSRPALRQPSGGGNREHSGDGDNCESLLGRVSSDWKTELRFHDSLDLSPPRVPRTSCGDRRAKGPDCAGSRAEVGFTGDQPALAWPSRVLLVVPVKPAILPCGPGQMVLHSVRHRSEAVAGMKSSSDV
jgi:hypothetical protein